MTTTDPNPLPDDDVTTAALELVGRTGAAELEVGWLDDRPAATRWWAHAQYRGARITVEGQPGPGEALQALATRLLHGGQCTSCHKLIAMSDDPVPIPARMLDGAAVDPDQIRARGLCRWTREGKHWIRGCGDPAPAGSSREKLAQALAAAAAPADMIAAARAGRWDEYLSEHAMPQHLLLDELRANGLDHLVPRVLDGDFDATPAESDAWAASPEGQAVFGGLLGDSLPDPPRPRQPWRSKRCRGGKGPRRR